MGGSSTSVITNTSRRGAYRGPWMFETIAREIMRRHRGAARLGIDPLELRRRNIVQQCRPCRTRPATGVDVRPHHAGRDARAGGGDARLRRVPPGAGGGARRRAVCSASASPCYVEPTAGGFGVGITESATIRIDPSGTIQVLSGVNSQGHSMETIIAQVTAEYLGVDIDDVEVLFGDTAIAPIGATTGGSRNAVFGGGAARQAALEMRDRVLEIAAHMLEASPDDLDIEGGVVSVRGTPSAQTTLAEIAQLAYMTPEGAPRGRAARARDRARGSRPTGPPGRTPRTSARARSIRDTGLVTLLRYIVSEDCGALINPNVVEGQIAGRRGAGDRRRAARALRLRRTTATRPPRPSSTTCSPPRPTSR